MQNWNCLLNLRGCISPKRCQDMCRAS